MSDHLSAGELSSLAFGTLKSEKLRAAVLHLQQCSPCVTKFYAFASRGILPPTQESDYDAVIDRAFLHARQTAQQLQVEESRINALVKLLVEGGPDALPAIIRKGWEIPLVEALLRRSWSLRQTSPSQMVELAEFAELGMRRVSTKEYGSGRVSDLYCRVWTELGNAYRIADRLEDSEEAFGRATEHYLQGTQDKLLLARFLDFRASLYRSSRDLTSAYQCLHLAYKIYRRHGVRHLAGRALISAAITLGYAGKPERAIRCIERGLSLIDREDDQELLMAAVHNRLWFLADCGRFDEARRILFQSRSRYTGTGDLNCLKLRWLEARLDTGLGKLARAEAGFREVKRDFEAAELFYDGALATLDLAAVVLRRAAWETAHDLVIEAANTLTRIGVHRQALEAILFLRESFELHIATLTTLEEVTEFLRRAQHDRNARYTPSIL